MIFQRSRYVRKGVIARPIYIVASPFQTGTKQVGDALIELGAGSARMEYDAPLLEKFQPLIRDLNLLANGADGFADFRDHYAKTMRTRLAGLVQAVAPFDIFDDAPFGHAHVHPFIRKVLAPEARFVWINRAADDWIASVRACHAAATHLYPNYWRWSEDPEGQRQLYLKYWRQQYRGFKRIRRGAPEDCLELEWDRLGDLTPLAAFCASGPAQAEN
jgi:hypothetical protein